jgi:RNA-directed DNA polymerase
LKRHGNLFEKIVSRQNILDAHRLAKKGKPNHKGVIYFEKNIVSCVNTVRDMLVSKSYIPSPYTKETIRDGGKDRVIQKVPYLYDRIIHHSVMQIVQPILEKTYIKDTYQSIKGRGIHKAKKRIDLFLKDKENTKYCLKIDIKKFYDSVDNELLKKMIRKKIKCFNTLELIDKIIDSAKGLPIGNYTSQTFGNYYLSELDHYIKEKLCVNYYIRYADDMIFLSSNKEELHNILLNVKSYLNSVNLELKNNYQIFPISERGIDYLGFRFFENFTILRKKIKKNMLKVVDRVSKGSRKLKDFQSFSSYLGWLKASDSYNLKRSIFKESFTKNLGIIATQNNISSKNVRLRILQKKQIGKNGSFEPNLFNFTEEKYNENPTKHTLRFRHIDRAKREKIRTA